MTLIFNEVTRLGLVYSCKHEVKHLRIRQISYLLFSADLASFQSLTQIHYVLDSLLISKNHDLIMSEYCTNVHDYNYYTI